MKEKLTKNLNLKIIAVLFSVGIWIISININDPYQSKTYSVTVQLQNMAAMTGAGKYVEIMNNTDEISVSVRANRSVLDSFSAANILATADLTEIDENNQVPIKLNTTRISGSKIESIRSDSTYVSLKVEDIRRIQKNIEVTVKNEPAEGYILGKASMEQNALKISGPESEVNKVAKATVTFDLEGATDDLSMLLPIELYDEAGERIIDSRLTVSIEEVQCTATILATKEVPLKFKVSGEAEKGYSWTGEVKGEPAVISIAAKSNILKNINYIDIPDAIDVSNAKADVKSLIDLKSYLPEGVSFVNPSFSGRVLVTAYVEPEINRRVNLESRRIQLINVPEGMEGKALLEDEVFELNFVGRQSLMAQLNEEEVLGYLDIQEYMSSHNLNELKPGTYVISLGFDLPDGIVLEENLEIEVEISSIE
ncbi:MAG: CdaR family protein [Lachnospiraceae bacterium]|nr:CdaR family protein [Lachnospiraceae bacterium]MDD7051528.1 CdaR family protein [Lachnospiraceae bacterium]MDY4097328.1 CdaR family protein [Lachnospiraceae bacterium]